MQKLTWMLAAAAAIVLPTVLVTTERPSKAATQLVGVMEFNGVVRAAQAADISPLFDGLIQSLNFNAGELVKKGQLLVQLMALEQEYRLKLDTANMAREGAELKLAEAELQRARELRQRKVNSPATLEVAVAKRDVAAAKYDSARTQAEMTQIIIKKFALYAPFDGIISEPFVNVGAYITKSAREVSRLATVTQLDPINVVTEVPYSIYADRIARLGSEEAIRKRIVVTLILPDGTEYPHPGKLIAGGFAFDEATQKIASLAEFPNPDRLLRPGLRVTLRSGIRPEPQ